MLRVSHWAQLTDLSTICYTNKTNMKTKQQKSSTNPDLCTLNTNIWRTNKKQQHTNKIPSHTKTQLTPSSHKLEVAVPGSWGRACRCWVGEEAPPPVPPLRWVVAAVAVTGTAQHKDNSLKVCMSHKGMGDQNGVTDNHQQKNMTTHIQELQLYQFHETNGWLGSFSSCTDLHTPPPYQTSRHTPTYIHIYIYINDNLLQQSSNSLVSNNDLHHFQKRKILILINKSLIAFFI